MMNISIATVFGPLERFDHHHRCPLLLGLVLISFLCIHFVRYVCMRTQWTRCRRRHGHAPTQELLDSSDTCHLLSTSALISISWHMFLLLALSLYCLCFTVVCDDYVHYTGMHVQCCIANSIIKQPTLWSASKIVLYDMFFTCASR